MNTFFKDLKIVELANVLAGPAVGMFFAELGAEVIKIENKSTNGDVTRSWKLDTEDKNSNTSAYFASVNWNKKHLFIDLKSDSEKQKIHELIKNADIVISNYKPGDDVKLLMDYETLKKINPKIIYAHLTGFGNEIHRTAYDIVLQAETGFMFMNGTKESGPLKIPVAVIDIFAAHQLKEAVLIAIIKKMKTGEGSKITLSLFDSAIASLANQASNWLMAGRDPQPIGSLHPNIAPYGEMFSTSDDKKIVLAIGNNRQFEKLCCLLDLNHLLNDLKFNTNSQRVKYRTELFQILESVIIKYPSQKIMADFIKNDVPAGLVKSVKEVFETNNLSSAILEDTNDLIPKGKRVKTVAFKISDL
jgi:crotonobetainyl-CoA:carnitine CoA-transferase CaiB-like acyl-CoA transferase